MYISFMEITVLYKYLNKTNQVIQDITKKLLQLIWKLKIENQIKSYIQIMLNISGLITVLIIF